MAENKIELKSVSELLGMKFFIPSYQRGYRWTEQQVNDLLNDVNGFKPTKDELGFESWYCLQPLVVARMKENDPRLDNENEDDKKDWYEVIDGQQRLTTIFIILNILNDQKLSLRYQTRSNSQAFLQSIKEDKNKYLTIDNIDFHFMLQAKEAIDNWINNLNSNRSDLITKLKDHCKMIWYETEENAYEVFRRLNSGKISLSNAELVKALLLKDDNFEDLDDNALYLKQLEMAGEWDRMEQVFHDNSFWFFINPEPEDARFNCTRIDFLLELILRRENTTNDFDYNLKQNDYLIFSKYSQKIANEGWEKIWRKIQETFRIIKSWYDDREKYHYIGYLMNLRGQDKKQSLIDLLQKSNLPKNLFLSLLKERCRNTLKYSEMKECYFQDLEYGKSNDEIHNILLLFNLATTQNQISEMSRYPFDKHFEAATHKWSLEHIHAQNEKKANWNKEELNKIKRYLSQLSVKGIDKLINYLKDKETSEDIDDNTYKAIMGSFMGVSIRYDEATKQFGSDFEKDDHLTNMALLQGDKNAAFNNKTYPEKREKLAEYENVEKEALFVPVCTRNVFFKHYSPLSCNPFVWDEEAELEYVTAIVKVVAAYLDLEPILPDNNIEKYGVKIKEDKI